MDVGLETKTVVVLTILFHFLRVISPFVFIQPQPSVRFRMSMDIQAIPFQNVSEDESLNLLQGRTVTGLMFKAVALYTREKGFNVLKAQKYCMGYYLQD